MFTKNAQLVCKYWLYKWIKSCYIFPITSYRMTKRVEMEKDVSKRKNTPVFVWVWLQYVALNPDSLVTDTFGSSSIFSNRKQSYNKPNLSKHFFWSVCCLNLVRRLSCWRWTWEFQVDVKVGEDCFRDVYLFMRLILTGFFFIPAYSKWAR